MAIHINLTKYSKAAMLKVEALADELGISQAAAACLLITRCPALSLGRLPMVEEAPQEPEALPLGVALDRAFMAQVETSRRRRELIADMGPATPAAALIEERDQVDVTTAAGKATRQMVDVTGIADSEPDCYFAPEPPSPVKRSHHKRVTK
jgi:hypothetical protein